ncbi:UDP-N-acetylglucosamine transferase subunit alg13 [Smittium culicis]|uniref:UDP-N-acetylglucosamine transferase subunit ALG13 n=1 Tax=Smittium culicis TaxID=133412 RepID=A0A1R1XU65_9FUNG|nr:UDP-N-acetylglucosamine transferase subunit alg13 [Smittium culicis]
MSIFATVGSTQFDDLVEIVTSLEFIDMLTENNIQSLTVQHGSSTPSHHSISLMNSYSSFNSSLPKIELFNYKNDITEFFNKADLIISHAGSGSIINALQAGKPIVVVANRKLMDNHQVELASELSSEQITSTQPANLLEVVKNLLQNKRITVNNFKSFKSNKNIKKLKDIIMNM